MGGVIPADRGRKGKGNRIKVGRGVGGGGNLSFCGTVSCCRATRKKMQVCMIVVNCLHKRLIK